MKFYFPDSRDQVDPNFDFVDEEHLVHRIAQRDDVYAHEALVERPFDGLLLSKAIVDSHIKGGAGHYSNATRSRLYREGIRRFFRFDRVPQHIETLGDCGAFAYVKEYEPPYSVDEVLDFYEGIGIDAGIAPDHIVFGFLRPETKQKSRQKSGHLDTAEAERRREVTLKNAAYFLERHQARKSLFQPVAVAHGWNVETYADSVHRLQELGYSRIAMGGMVPLKTVDILDVLNAVKPILKPDVGLHLLGVTRTDEIPRFASLGVTSFDSTSPFRQSFQDANDNFYTDDGAYVAIRIPQVDGNAKVRRAVSAGRLNQRSALDLERRALQTVRGVGIGESSVEEALTAVLDYVTFLGLGTKYEEEYRRTLTDRPWELCNCGVCDRVGVEVILFRGSERNKRRGFHNLAVFRRRLNNVLGKGSL